MSSHGERLSLYSGSDRCQPATFRGFRTAPFSLQARLLRNHIAEGEEIAFLLSQGLCSEWEMKASEKGFEAYDAYASCGAFTTVCC